MRIYKNKFFEKWSKSAGITESTLKNAVKEMEAGLIDAHLGGDLFKKRVARKGEGKRGGFRTLVAFRKGQKTIFVYGFAKNQLDNLDQNEKKIYKELAKNLLSASESRLKDMIINGDLYEVLYAKEKK